MPTIVGVLTFISMINITSERLEARNFFIRRYFSFYEQLKFHAHLSWARKKLYNLETRSLVMVSSCRKVANWSPTTCKYCCWSYDDLYTLGRQQSKTSILSTNVDQKSLETVFDCHFSPTWRQMAIKTLFLAIFDLCLSIVKSVFDRRLPGML